MSCIILGMNNKKARMNNNAVLDHTENYTNLAPRW